MPGEMPPAGAPVGASGLSASAAGQRRHHGAAPGAGVADDADHPLAGRRQQIQQAADLPFAVQHRAGRRIDGQEVAARRFGRGVAAAGGGGRCRGRRPAAAARVAGAAAGMPTTGAGGGLGGRPGTRARTGRVPGAPGSRPGTGRARLARAGALGHAGGAGQRAQHHRAQPGRLLAAEAQQLHRAAARAQQRQQQVQRRRLAGAQAGGDLVAGTGEVLHREARAPHAPDATALPAGRRSPRARPAAARRRPRPAASPSRTSAEPGGRPVNAASRLPSTSAAP